MWANGDNIGLQPWFVDNHVEFRKAVHVRIKGRRETSFDVDYLDVAHEFDETGKLKWNGRIKNWTLAPGQGARALFAPGIDADGDYYTSKDGQPAHWVLTDIDTGRVIEPA
jgi:outer membrane protein assembly factor BamB